jgi:hypothetical protein
LCINLQRTIRGFAAICGATVAFGGASALSNATFAQTPAAPAPAPAPAPAAPAAPTATPWTYQGLFDAYYLYDGNLPKGAPSADITGFNYDAKASTPTIALAELNIAKAAPANGGLGFKTTLMAGDDVNQIYAAGTNEARYQNIQQLYITLAAKSGAGLDIGKFYTPFGYEVVESNANYNYSRSFIFTDLLPVYHAGVRLYTPSYKGLVFTVYLVKSLINLDLGSGDAEGVYDQNKSIGYVGNLNYTAPNGKYTAIESYGKSSDGPEGFEDKVGLSDFDFTFNATPVDTLGFEWTNRQDSVQTLGGAYANGYAGYYQHKISGVYTAAFRAEEIEAKAAGKSPRIDSLTATLSDQTTKSLLVRLEFRHDDSKIPTTSPYFGGFAGGPSSTGATQNTLSLSGVYTFGP